MITLYVAPPVTDRATHYRIFAAALSHESRHAWESYKNNPRIWKEVGLVNSQGELVCLDACKAVFDEVKACEPLTWGVTFQFDSLHTEPSVNSAEDWQPGFKENVYYITDGKVRSDVIASGLSLGDALRMKSVGNLFRTLEDAHRSMAEDDAQSKTAGRYTHGKSHP